MAADQQTVDISNRGRFGSLLIAMLFLPIILFPTSKRQVFTLMVLVGLVSAGSVVMDVGPGSSIDEAEIIDEVESVLAAVGGEHKDKQAGEEKQQQAKIILMSNPPCDSS